MSAKEELECRKLKSEIEQLGLQNRKLSRELKEKQSSVWQMPSAWEVLKSVGIFLPLLFASLGYCRSLEQDRRAQFEHATKVYFGEGLGAGPYLLDTYAAEHCGKQGYCGEDLECREKCRQTVVSVLISGVRIRDEGRALERSRLAMQTLLTLPPNKALTEELCRRVADDVVFIHERYVRRAFKIREDLDKAQEQEEIDAIDLALRNLRPVICTAVENDLCPEAQLKTLAPKAWEEIQSYLKMKEIECKP